MKVFTLSALANTAETTANEYKYILSTVESISHMNVRHSEGVINQHKLLKSIHLYFTYIARLCQALMKGLVSNRFCSVFSLMDREVALFAEMDKVKPEARE